MRGNVRLRHEQDEPEPEEGEARPRERDDREPEQRQQETDTPREAGQDDAGMGELEDDAHDAEQEEQPDQVGVGQDQQQPRLPADAMGVDARPGDVHGQVLVGERAPVDLREQALQRRRDDIGDVRGDCLGGSPVARTGGAGSRFGGDRALGQRGVAPVLARRARAPRLVRR